MARGCRCVTGPCFLAEDGVAAKILSYNRANRAVAVLCNHQRATPKTFEKSMQTLRSKVRGGRGGRASGGDCASPLLCPPWDRTALGGAWAHQGARGQVLARRGEPAKGGPEAVLRGLLVWKGL